MRDRYHDRKKKVLVIWLAGARLLLRPEKKSSSRITTGKKKIQSSVWRVRNHYYDGKIKSSSPLSGGCAIVITTGKKKILLSVWQVRDRYYNWKKKSSSRLSGGCMIVITTGKKKI